MQKREFLQLMGSLGVGLCLPQLSFAQLTESRESLKFWVWKGVNAEASDTELRNYFELLRDSGVTGILLGGDDERHFSRAAEYGLDAHLWMWTMNRRDEFIMKNHPEWYAVNRLGESCFDKPQYVDYYRWLCPSKTEVQDFLIEEVKVKASKPYIRGIHLDYVRYCDVILPRALWEKYGIVQNEELPPYDYCYCDTCRSAFNDQYGDDPLNLEDPANDTKWLQYRYDSITSIVNRLSTEVHNLNKPISAAVFPSPTIAKKLVRQEWNKWDLDMVFPMVYQGFYNEDVEWIRDCIDEDVAAVGHKIKVYAGLYLPDLSEKSAFDSAVDKSIESGASGVSLFGQVDESYWTKIQELSE